MTIRKIAREGKENHWSNLWEKILTQDILQKFFEQWRNVLRDILVHFVRKKTRNQVLQQYFNTRLKWIILI